ncbi:hypothetical protein [Paenibacillus sp. L3-i20]|uniref:hypothetical protein n=1 Tax=Paenibacillus sp. L3-i20 TaxID=2905833 RepID=UPI001EE0BAA5|nr:hypothetical protein [Paenibacillus sp. L3-i20]GKU77595.1 hypothetical protein L3i20_v219920 [Paenibacillus sp. L3-i20]
MIYGASLGPFVKKAITDKGFQTNSQKLIDLLPLDSSVSKMDAVVLGPKDVSGWKGKALKAAVKAKHSSVGVIYFYQKDSEIDLIEGDILKIKVEKLTLEQVSEAVQTVIDGKVISEDQQMFESADMRGYLYNENESEKEVDTEPLETPQPFAVQQIAQLEVSAGLEERVVEIGKFTGFDYLKKQLSKEHIQHDLSRQNMEYAEVVNMLDELDSQIAKVFKDSSIPPDMRFEKLKHIGVNRAAYKGLESSLVADKLTSVMESVLLSAEETVDARINQMREALDTITSARLLYEDHGKLEELINARLSVQMDLMELSKEIIEMYQAMDLSVNELIDHVQDKGPSNYAYINEIMDPIKPLFIPQNMAAITSRLLNDLHRNKLTFSIIEEKIKSVINLVFKLCEEDATIIAYQQKLIKLLQSQRVEDVVIVDHVIKNSLRLFIGPADTGRTATALTWSGIVSRRQNTLLLDLTGQTKLAQYGVEPMELDEFLETRVERQFLCVAGNSDNMVDRVEAIVSELKKRLNYYAHIHVLLDASQTALMSHLASSALSIHFITDCTPRGAELLKPVVEAFQEPNIAQKVILIDPPVDPIRLVNDIGIDPLLAKVIVLPHLKHVRACSLNRMKPYESKEVEEVFEEAFR